MTPSVPKKSNNRKGRKPAPRRRRNGNNNNRITQKQVIKTGTGGFYNNASIRRPLIEKKFVEAGSDFLTPLTVLASTPTVASKILVSGSISPSAFPGTRLTQLSNLWERYRFRKFRLRWVPAVPKSIACQLIVYQDTDPLDDPSTISSTDALIRQATSQAGSQQFNFINPMTIDLARRSDDQLYYTGADKNNERFNRQGNYYIIQVTDPLDFNGKPLIEDIMAGSLYVDWVCEFQIAQINPSAFAALEPCADPVLTELTIREVGQSVGNNDFGILTCSQPFYASLRTLNPDIPVNPPGAWDLTITLGTTTLLVKHAVGDNIVDLDTPLQPAGSYTVSTTVTGSGFALVAPITLNVISLNGAIPTFTPA
jgi:hypothetical protein